MTTKGIQAHQVADAFNAVPGSFTLLDGDVTSSIDIDVTATAVQISPESGSFSYTPLVAGKHKVDLSFLGLMQWATANENWKFKVVFDEGLGSEVVVGDDETWGHRSSNQQTSHYLPFYYVGEAVLEAKTYTVKAYGTRQGSNGSILIPDQGGRPQIAIAAVTGSGTGGTLHQRVVITGTGINDDPSRPTWPVTGSSFGTFTAVPGLSLGVNANSSDVIGVLVRGNFRMASSSGSLGLDVKRNGTSLYDIIGGIDADCMPWFDTKATNELGGIALTTFVPAVDGLNTITVEATDSAGSAEIYEGTTLETILFRGGLHRWSQDGVPQTDTPQGVNVVGPALQSSVVNGEVQLQGNFVPDTKPPQGSWATVTTVEFDPRPGQPSVIRRTLQDGKQRIWDLSSTATWATSNGVADLGWDETASSTGNSKFSYWYLVPKSGDDNQLTVRASDNAPGSGGPTGYSNWELIWSAYEDSGGDYVPVYQRGNWFHYIDQTQTLVYNYTGTSEASPTSVDLAAFVPESADEIEAHARVNKNTTTDDWFHQLFADGTNLLWGPRDANGFPSGAEVRLSGKLPLLTSQTVHRQVQRISGAGTLLVASLYVFAWRDPWVAE